MATSNNDRISSSRLNTFATELWTKIKNTFYMKPSNGIPKTDLDSSVQTSLGKADSALQSHQSLDGYVNGITEDSTTTFVDSTSIVVNKSGKNVLYRTAIGLWNYIKGKADSVYATLTHYHSASDITSGKFADSMIESASNWNGKLDKSGGTMTGNIGFSSIGTWPTASGETYPIESNGLHWAGSSDTADIYYSVEGSDKGRLNLDMGDDGNADIAFKFGSSSSKKTYTINSDGYYTGSCSESNVANSWKTGRNFYVADATSAHTGSESYVDGGSNVTLKLPSTITASLVGDVTGNCSGSSGSCSGNASTATIVRKDNEYQCGWKRHIQIGNTSTAPKGWCKMVGITKTSGYGDYDSVRVVGKYYDSNGNWSQDPYEVIEFQVVVNITYDSARIWLSNSLSSASNYLRVVKLGDRNYEIQYSDIGNHSSIDVYYVCDGKTEYTSQETTWKSCTSGGSVVTNVRNMDFNNGRVWTANTATTATNYSATGGIATALASKQGTLPIKDDVYDIGVTASVTSNKSFNDGDGNNIINTYMRITGNVEQNVNGNKNFQNNVVVVGSLTANSASLGGTGITGDLNVSGTIYGNVNNADMVDNLHFALNGGGASSHPAQTIDFF